MEIIIRTATFDDLKEIQHLFKETILNTCKNDYSLNERKVWSEAIKKTDKWKQSLKEEYFIVAILKNKIVGFSSLKNNHYLNLMYVHKNYTRKGIATLLYQKIKEKSIALGFKNLQTDASITARPFFEKIGFKILHENKNIIRDEVLINYKMVD